MYGVLDISTSALVAQRINLDVIAGNIAMKDVTRDEQGNPIPYRRRAALFAPGDPSRGRDAPGVHVTAIVEDPTAFPLRWDPTHVDVHTEMINAMTAQRTYEANVTVIEMMKSMSKSTLRLIA